MTWGKTQQKLLIRKEKGSGTLPVLDHMKKNSFFKIICHLEIKPHFVIPTDYKKMNLLLEVS